MTKEEAVKITGGLSQTSKMPCPSYNLPAQNCIKGVLLQTVVGSVCHKCYAMRGFYRFDVPQRAMARRLASLSHPQWEEAMIFLIKDAGNPYWRWHDSGDLQSTDHLESIIRIAEACPEVNFWLPTKEYKIVSLVLAKKSAPKNLTIRLSSYMVNDPKSDKATATVAKRLGVKMSSAADQYTCPASEQDEQCLDCRKCWSGVFNVTYKFRDGSRKKKKKVVA